MKKYKLEFYQIDNKTFQKKKMKANTLAKAKTECIKNDCNDFYMHNKTLGNIRWYWKSKFSGGNAGWRSKQLNK